MGLFFVLGIVAIAYWFFRSPLCSAMSDSIRRSGMPWHEGAAEGTELRQLVEELRTEMGELRAEVTELAERVDFAERVLIELRQRDVLPGQRAGS